MFYIHKISSISPVNENALFNGGAITPAVENKLFAIEPAYTDIPKAQLRRMAKAVRVAVGAALPLVKDLPSSDGIIIGTANGGMEESVKFMNQLIEYEEGMLTPGNFVQSTPNGLSSQIAMIDKNRRYNITHTHRGLSFENALLDAADLIAENPGSNYLLGGADEISSYNFNIDFLAGWYRQEQTNNEYLFDPPDVGSVAGEGAAMFLVSSKPEQAIAHVVSATTLHSEDLQQVNNWLTRFINDQELTVPTLLLTGDSGDSRFSDFYKCAEELVGPDHPVLRFKHLTGEFSTASALGLYLACRILQEQKIPESMIKHKGKHAEVRQVIFYNNYHGSQHAVIVLRLPEIQ